MPVRIQFRRGTASQWTTNNPVLAAGELGLETDTNTYKIGNGTSNWNSLPYQSLPANAIASTLFDAKGDLLVADGADSAARLPVGTNGSVVMADSGETTGVKWQTIGDDASSVIGFGVFQ